MKCKSIPVSIVWTRSATLCKILIDFKPGVRFEIFCVLNHVIYDTILLLMCKKHFDVISCVQVVIYLCNRGESIMQNIVSLFDYI